MSEYADSVMQVVMCERMIRMGCFSNEEIADATNIPLSEIVKLRGAEQ